MKPHKRTILQFSLAAAIVLSTASSIFGYKLYRSFYIAKDTRDQIKYLVGDENASVGSVDANYALSPSYLSAVFGDNPQLLEKLHGVIQSGLQNTKQLRLDKVSAMLVTYRLNNNEEVVNLATHVIGDYKVGRRKPGFHRDGYFKHLLDQNIWNAGNTVVGFLGRDIVFYAKPEDIEFQTSLIDSLYTGEVELMLEAIENPYFYTMVIPNPRRLLPPQLRHHIQTIIIKGSMEKYHGESEIIFLCSNPKSAKHTVAVLDDMKTAAEAILQTKFGGVVKERSWGPYIESWWAREMVLTSESALLRQEENIVRLNTTYGRVMNNALIKSFERLGRDLRQITGSLEQGKDPRLVDAEMISHKGSHYWSEDHRWGPNWPIEPPEMDEFVDPNAAKTPVPAVLDPN